MLFVLLGYDIYQQTNPANTNVGSAWLGVGAPVAIAGIGLAIGIVIMILQRIFVPDPFFRWKRSTAEPGILEEATSA